MKALRYLLIVMMLSAASVLFAAAQNLAQQPKAEMHSTSGMVYSGSALPSAAASGAVVTGNKLGTYETASTTNGPHKAAKGLGGGGESGDPGNDRPEPWEDPLGDAALPLMLLCLVYVCARAFLKKRA
jgi:hypothetical protein